MQSVTSVQRFFVIALFYSTIVGLYLWNQQFACWPHNGMVQSDENHKSSTFLTSVKTKHGCPKENISFKSQSNEDKALFSRYYNKSNAFKCGTGTIVEIGALDGVKLSNSYWFENALDWRSILIEANPFNYGRLVKNRPNAVNINAAMCSGESAEFVIGAGGAVGGVAETMAEKFRQHWGTNRTIMVPCDTLENIFRMNDVNHIDVFSLDVEGGEFAVLQTMDWSVSVDVWVIELDGHNPQKDNDVVSLLAQQGYVQADWNIRSFCTPGKACPANVVFEPHTE